METANRKILLKPGSKVVVQKMDAETRKKVECELANAEYLMRRSEYIAVGGMLGRLYKVRLRLFGFVLLQED